MFKEEAMTTEKTPEGRTMDLDGLMRLNQNAIQILNLPRMLALILKKCFPEQFPEPLEELEERLRRELPRSSDKADPGRKKHLRNDLTNRSNENPKTGLMQFDSIILKVVEVEPGAFLVNVEVQNKVESYSWFSGRVYSYIARMLDSQKDDQAGYAGDRYQDLKPVIALWILSHERETWLISYPGKTKIDVGRETGSAKAMKSRLDGVITYRIIGLGPDWMDHEEEAVQCLGFIFRCDEDKEKQYDYLEKEGIPMTVETEKVLDEYSDAQFQWFHRSEEEKYNRMKAEMDEKLQKSDEKLQKLREQNEMYRKMLMEAGLGESLSVAENASFDDDADEQIRKAWETGK